MNFKYLKSYKIFEGKQVGNLYHIFDINKFIYILKYNKLSSYKFYNISTTRNKNLNFYLGEQEVNLIDNTKLKMISIEKI